MKKVLALAAMMVLASASMVQAAASTKQVELGIGGGVAVATSAGNDLGFGGSASGLFKADESLGFGLGVGFHTFSVTGFAGASNSSLDFQAIMKAGLGNSATKPYVLVGAGMASFSVSIPAFTFGPITIPASSASSFYPVVSGGLGIQFPAGDSMNIYLQAVADIVLATGGTFTYIPVDLGINFDM